jgi:hypothetical protein
MQEEELVEDGKRCLAVVIDLEDEQQDHGLSSAARRRLPGCVLAPNLPAMVSSLRQINFYTIDKREEHVRHITRQKTK